MAAVVVSVVHVLKGAYCGPRLLDGREVGIITAFLFHAGGNDNPKKLLANERKSFVGCDLKGEGFTFSDNDTTGVATPIAVMKEVIEKNPRNSSVIFPYIGGEEVNSSPTLEHNRYIITFSDLSEEEARERHPELMRIVEEKVKPERAGKSKEVAAAPWWKFWRTRRELFQAISGLEHVLVTAQVSEYRAFAFQPVDRVFAMMLIVFPLPTFAAFCSLQARPHEIWARFFGSTLEDRLRYTPSDCFETFPLAPVWETGAHLDAAGRSYYEFRRELMIRNGEGLTQTYNRFHDPDERDPNIVRLRELHIAMDRAVLDSYGWTDVSTDCEFLLEYEVEEETGGRRKKPWRYRWPDEVRDDVLARLLELNGARATEEAQPEGRSGNALRVSSVTAANLRSIDVRERIVDALRLDLVGPWPGHSFADERLPGWIRPSNWYLTGFLIPSGAPPEQSADDDEEDELGAIPESESSAEESNEERKAAKKAFFPSSMGLSFLISADTSALAVEVNWGDYTQQEHLEDEDGKDIRVWQRHARAATVSIDLARDIFRTGPRHTRLERAPAPRRRANRRASPRRAASGGYTLGLGVSRQPSRTH